MRRDIGVASTSIITLSSISLKAQGNAFDIDQV